MERPLHIALYAPAWPVEAYQNGIITYVHTLRAQMRALGHRVSVVTSIMPAGFQEGGVWPPAGPGWLDRVARVPVVRRWVPEETYRHAGRIARAFAELHRRDPVDVIEMEETFGWFAAVQQAVPVPVLTKLHGPGFLTVVGEDAATEATRRRCDAEGAALRAARFILSPARHTLASTLAHYGLAPTLAQVIRNPSPVPESRRWNLAAADRGTVLFVGRFDEIKGADIALQAFARLAAARPGVRLRLVGPDRGVIEGGRRLMATEYLAEHLPAAIRERVDLLGAVSPDVVAQERLRSHVTIVSSRVDNQPNTLLEAMGLGCPIVGSPAAGVRELVRDGQNALQCETHEPGDIATAMARLLDDDDLCRRLGAEARRYVTVEHDPRVLAEQTVEAYHAARVAAVGKR
jgi:glycosyltransferase involved in cell wall biosynthesis